MKLMLNYQIIYILSLILYSKCEEAKKIYNNNYLVPQTPNQISQAACQCLSTYPACCTPEFETYKCGCAPRPVCAPCGFDNFVKIHDSALKLAVKAAYDQQDLAQKAKKQVILFQKAQEYAKEAGIQELKAKKYATMLNEATKKAQMARIMMFKTASLVRDLADRTYQAIQPIRCVGIQCNGLNRIAAFRFKQVNPLKKTNFEMI